MILNHEGRMFPLARAIAGVVAGLAVLASAYVSACALPPRVVSGYEVTAFPDHKTLAVTEGVARFSVDFPLRYQAGRSDFGAG